MEELSWIINDVVDALTLIGICVVLPIIVVWLITRERINRDNMRKDIILAAMEKNSDIDVEEMMKKLNRPKTLLKVKQLWKLLIGSILFIFSILWYVTIGVWACLGGGKPEMFMVFSFFAVVPLAIGIAFLINYLVGKKMLAKEMEAEEQNLRQTRE